MPIKSSKEKIKAFGEVSKRLGLSSRVYRGIQAIPLGKIVGSVGRAADLLPGFKLKHPDTRYYRIRRAMERGEILPPIIVYKVGDEYYVLDGNHRVAVAKELGKEFIDAEVIEFFPSPRVESKALRKKRAEFEKITGLQGIDATEPLHYDAFLNYIRDHAKQMSLSLGREVPLQEAALNWFLCVYTPVVQKIVERNLEETFVGKGLADIFAYIMDYKWFQSQKVGYDIGFEKALEGFIREIIGTEPSEEATLKRRTLSQKVGGLLEEVLPWLKRE